MAKHKSSKQQPDAKLIYNPGAGDHADVTARLDEVVRTLKAHKITVDVALAHPKEAATPLASRAVKEGFKLVIAMGGDGTIEAVAKGLIGTKARLGIIPDGTVNNMAKSLGIPVDFDGAAQLIKEGHERKIDVGRLKVKGKKKKYYFLEAAGIGLTGTLFPKGKDLDKGKWQEIGDVIGTFLNYSTPKVSLTLDDESHIEEKTMLVTVANGPAFGMTFLVAPDASMEDGYLNVCTYPNFSKADLVAYFATVAKGGQSDDQRVERYRAKKVKIKSKPKLDAVADAEPVGKGDFTIRVLPGALRVITGKETGLAVEPQEAAKGLPAPLAPANPTGQQSEQQAQPASPENQPEESKSLLQKLAIPAAAAGIIGAGLVAIDKLQDKHDKE